MDFKTIMFGEMTLGEWGGYCTLFLIGMLLLYVLKYRNRKDKTTTFSRGYFWHINGSEILAGFILMYIVIRIYSDIYPYMKDLAVLKYDLSQIAGVLLLGFLSQAITKYLSKRLGMTKSQDVKSYKDSKTH